jgi:penicillin-binding protein 1B
LSFFARVFAFLAVLWRFLRAPVLVGIGLAIGFVVPYAFWLDGEVRARFDDLSWEIPSRVYARALELAPGAPMTADVLKIELDAARYVEDSAAKTPGTYARDAARFTIARRGFVYLDGREREKRFTVTRTSGSSPRASRRCMARSKKTGASCSSARCRRC